MAIDAKAVGQRLTEERELRRESLSAVAEKAEIAKSYLLKLERGEVENPGLATLGAVAKALDITLAQLFAPAPTKVDSKKVRAGDEDNLELLKAKMPESLRRFLAKLEETETVPADVVRSLAVIQFRGQRPQHEDDWEFIYQAVKRSVRKG